MITHFRIVILNPIDPQHPIKYLLMTIQKNWMSKIQNGVTIDENSILNHKISTLL